MRRSNSARASIGKLAGNFASLRRQRASQSAPSNFGASLPWCAPLSRVIATVVAARGPVLTPSPTKKPPASNATRTAVADEYVNSSVAFVPQCANIRSNTAGTQSAESVFVENGS